MDLRRYFARRRDGGISEGSLRTYYAVLEKLYKANHWDWPLESGDRPEMPSEITTPAFTRDEVEQLIRNRELYSKGECFYLAVATIYDRICVKGLGVHKKGYGWHSLRRTLATLLPTALAKADKPLTLVGYFLRWSRRSTGSMFLGTPMGGIYARPEIMGEDPFFTDREVFEVHPFLPLWAEETEK
jgi:hypothetical protein